MRRATRVAGLAVLWSQVFWLGPASSQGGAETIDSPPPVVVSAGSFRVDSLRGRARVLLDPSGELALSDVRSSRAPWTVAQDAAAFDRGYRKGALWVSWSVHNADSRPRLLRFLVGTPQIDQADMYIVRAGDEIETQRGGDSVESTTAGWRPAVDVALESQERAEIFARIQTTSAMSAAIRGTDVATYANDARSSNRYSGLMLGLLLGLLVYHLAAYVSGRERLHFWYSAQTAALMLYGPAVDGTAGLVLPGWPELVSRLPIIAVAALGLTVTQFLRYFLNVPGEGGWRDRAFLGLAWLAALSLPLVLLLPARSGAPLATLLNVCVILGSLVLAASEARRQPAAVVVVLVGWSAVVVLGVYAAAGALGAGGELDAGRNLMSVAFLFERITMALPLAARIQQLHERSVTQQAEVVEARQQTARESVQRLDVETKLQAKEAELRQSQKMEVVGQLAGGLAHDFNNTLQVVLSMAELLRLESVGPAEREEMLDSLTHTAEQSAAITRRLLLLSRTDAKAPTPVDVNVMLGDLLNVLRRIMGSQIVTKFEPADGPCVLRADAMQFEQALTNLAINARDAMPDGGILAVRVSRLGADELPAHLEAMSGTRYVVIEVADTGDGIDPQVRERIFEPFFTTKPAGAGTGLGLAMVKGMLEAHDGLVDIDSKPGQGTRFRIYLPLIAAGDAVEPIREPPTSGGTERLLVVEDHPKIRVYLQQVLRNAGYDVQTARDGRDALAILADDEGNPPDLIVSDLVMPGVTGWQLLEEVRLGHPQQPFLFCSGYSEEFVHQRVTLDEHTRLLSKPFAGDSLLREVRASLAARTA